MKTSDDNPIYTKEWFEVVDFTSNKYSNSLRNIVAHIISLVAKVVREEQILPKGLVFVLDTDFIKQSGVSREHAEISFREILRFLLKEISRLISKYKEFLPKKAKQEFFPHCILIAPPEHKYFSNNKMRKFSVALETIVTEYPGMCTLRLKKIWSDSDGSLYRPEQRRFTPEGFQTYWMAVNLALKFWNRVLNEIMIKKQKKELYHLDAGPAHHRMNTQFQHRNQHSGFKEPQDFPYKQNKHHKCGSNYRIN